MKTIILYNWTYYQPASGKRVETRYKLTAEEARGLADAEPIEHTREERQVPDDPWANSTSGFQRS